MAGGMTCGVNIHNIGSDGTTTFTPLSYCNFGVSAKVLSLINNKPEVRKIGYQGGTPKNSPRGRQTIRRRKGYSLQG